MKKEKFGHDLPPLSEEEELEFLREHYKKSGIGLVFHTEKGDVVMYGTLSVALQVEDHLKEIHKKGYDEGWAELERIDFRPSA
jgi:hypothetical protein